jgi:hypothetical protein
MSSSSSDKLVSLWSATLETWSHELLFQRHVYPRDTFCPTKFLGVSCHACRHPKVVNYIANALQVIVPSIVTGSIEHVSLVIMKDCFNVSETFTLTLSLPLTINDNQSEQQESLQHVERSMRDLILSVLSLEGLARKRLTDDSSFKLTVKTAETIDKLSPEMTRAFDEGTWYRPSIVELDKEESEKTGKVQPLHHGSLPSGGTMHMILVTDSYEIA